VASCLHGSNPPFSRFYTEGQGLLQAGWHSWQRVGPISGCCLAYMLRRLIACWRLLLLLQTDTLLVICSPDCCCCCCSCSIRLHCPAALLLIEAPALLLLVLLLQSPIPGSGSAASAFGCSSAAASNLV